MEMGGKLLIKHLINSSPYPTKLRLHMLSVPGNTLGYSAAGTQLLLLWFSANKQGESRTFHLCHTLVTAFIHLHAICQNA